ncbi:alpha/beta hydrolase [Rubinisphaera margarita]|uniref:alpha/beta hydrolase n=1 Tax=Rubinisphaera margarita TaxID=2909586 RepID=UPI001EE95B9D|nr:alpha/beta hydrolase [Rubinisphaera margarita]MCG6154451.1 alpha/beta hydrolase [Rubinisphaera margarita]
MTDTTGEIKVDGAVSAAKSRSRTSVRNLLILAIVLLGGSLVFLAMVQRKLIYHPVKSAALDPADWGFRPGRCLDVEVEISPGITLHGWHVLPPDHQALDRDEQMLELEAGRPAILFFPGNAGHRGYRADHLRLLSSLQADVFLVDYRGYAENPGAPSEAVLTADARKIWNHMTDELGVPAERIILLGESLGGGVATALASELCSDGVSPGGLFLESTFSSMTETAQFHFPLLPVSLLLADRYPSEKRIESVDCPITMIHGRRDEIVPFPLGERLFAAAPEQSANGVAKSFVELPGVNHNDLLLLAETEYLRAMDSMLRNVRSR